ncbi:MAG: hypothetical protein SF123_20075 [Chloroflexota bacterium]|nr:hypothetical protein [Chloroflexota bacterium]
MLYILIVVLPWLVLGVMLLRLRLPADGMTPAAVPFGAFNDGVFYWHQAETFRVAGFNGGIYSVDEQRQVIDSVPFYTWGPFIPMLYGSIGRVFGWALYSIPLINLVLLSLALAAYIWLVRPALLGAALLVLFLGTSNLLLFASTLSLVTVLNAAFAVMYALIFTRLLSPGSTIKRWEWWAGGLLLLIGSLILPIWGTLFVPYFALLLRNRSVWTILAGVGIGFVCFAAALVAFMLLGAPFPNAASEILANLRISMDAGIERLLLNIRQNLQYHVESTRLENWTRVQVVVLVAIALALAGRWLSRKRVGWRDLRVWEWLFHAYHLGFLYLLFITIYLQIGYSDYRQFAPRLLLSTLLLIGLRRYTLAAVVVLSMLPAIVFVYEPARFNMLNHVSADNNAQILEWQSQLSTVLVYDPAAPSPWCNTVMMSQYYVHYELQLLTAIPGGIGLSFDFGDLTGPPFRSRYLLLHDDIYARYASQLTVVPLLEVPQGTLYANAMSACPLPISQEGDLP